MWKTDLENPTHILASITCNRSLTKSRQTFSQFRGVLMAGRLPPHPQMIKNILQLVYLLQLTKNGHQATIQLAVIVHSSVVWITSPIHHFYLQYYLQSLPPASWNLLPLHPLSHIITELEYHTSGLLVKTPVVYPVNGEKKKGNPLHQSILQSYISCQNFTFA